MSILRSARTHKASKSSLHSLRTNYSRQWLKIIDPSSWHLFKASTYFCTCRNIRKRCEICSKLTTKTAERRHGRHCQLWTYFTPCFSVVEIEQVNVGWVSFFSKMIGRNRCHFPNVILTVVTRYISEVLD